MQLRFPVMVLCCCVYVELPAARVSPTTASEARSDCFQLTREPLANHQNVARLLRAGSAWMVSSGQRVKASLYDRLLSTGRGANPSGAILALIVDAALCRIWGQQTSEKPWDDELLAAVLWGSHGIRASVPRAARILPHGKRFLINCAELPPKLRVLLNWLFGFLQFSLGRDVVNQSLFCHLVRV